MTDQTLEPIMTDLLNEVFKGAVTLEDLVVHLKDTAQRDLENASVQMILDAIAGIEKPPEDWNDSKDSHIDWKEIHFGSQETLGFCDMAARDEIGIKHEPQLETNLDMCMFFLCAALLSDACRKREGPGKLCNLRYTLAPFHLYINPNGRFVIRPYLDRLLRYIFRQ